MLCVAIVVVLVVLALVSASAKSMANESEIPHVEAGAQTLATKLADSGVISTQVVTLSRTEMQNTTTSLYVTFITQFSATSRMASTTPIVKPSASTLAGQAVARMQTGSSKTHTAVTSTMAAATPKKSSMLALAIQATTLMHTTAITTHKGLVTSTATTTPIMKSSASTLAIQASTSVQTATSETHTPTVLLRMIASTTSNPWTSLTTAKAFCFEMDVLWEPLDMKDELPSQEVDEWACQQKCFSTSGCSHFSYWTLGGFCHLQDQYALRRGRRPGFVSGPFHCWEYLVPGKFTRTVPKFRCMQIGVVWEPDMYAVPPRLLGGEREEVVLRCQKLCGNTSGCAHFTVMFPSTCRLAGTSAVPVPAAPQTMSGPATSECAGAEVSNLPSPSLGRHALINRAVLLQAIARHAASGSEVHAPLVIAMVMLAVALAALWRRGGPLRRRSRGLPGDGPGEGSGWSRGAGPAFALLGSGDEGPAWRRLRALGPMCATS